jgi:preprotein translocase subunit SecA
MAELGESPPTLITSPSLHFPEHVTREWIQSPLDSLHLGILPPDSETAVRIESKISPKETGRLLEIKSLEQTFIENAGKHENEPYFKTEFESLKSQWAETPASDFKKREKLINQSCALGLAVYKASYPSIDVWDTQRVALVRMSENFLDTKTDGLIINLATGMGKSSVLIPTILPTAYMVHGHADVTSLTPASRSESIHRFAPLAKHLGMTIGELDTLPLVIAPDGTQFRVSSQSGKRLVAQMSDVVFSLPEEQGFELMKDVFRKPEPIVHKNTCAINDESDRRRVEEYTHPMVISGQEEPTETILTRYWNVFKPEMTSNPQDETYHIFLKRTLSVFTPEHQYPDNGNSISETENANTAFALMKEYQKEAQNLSVKDLDNGKLYREPDGTITLEGEYDIFRRLWLTIEKRPYDSKQMLPKDWYTFFNTVYPPQVHEAMQTAIMLTRDKDYFIQDGIDVLSPYTNWPQPGKEFFPLVQIALYAKEAAYEGNITLPTTLHETISMIQPLAINELLYGKSMEFTGTGTPVTEWYRKALNLEITRIPPQFETSRIETTIGCLANEKDTRVLSLLKTYESQESPPVLLSVPTRDDINRLSGLLGKQFPELTIQTMLPEETSHAKSIFTKAGEKHVVTIVLGGMATREVDVLVSENLDTVGGLHVIAYAPLLDLRNDAQFAGRAARAGRKGTYVRLASQGDEVFSRFSDNEKRKIAHDISSGNIKELNRWISKGQEGTDDRTLFNAEQYIAMNKPFVWVWRQLIDLPLQKRQLFQPVWGDFLRSVETQGRLLFSSNYSFRTKPPSIQAKLWEIIVRDAYTECLKIIQTEPPENTQTAVAEKLNEFFSQKAMMI